MTVLVTGGTGFVGSHVAARLAACGHSVRLIVRDPAKVAHVPAFRTTPRMEVVTGDVTDRQAVERALEGCTAVVHSAALVSLAERDAARVEAVNVGGTRFVVSGAAERDLMTVYLSSVSVFGAGTAPITIDTPVTVARGGYTRSKIAAEAIVRELRDDGAPVTLVYPSAVLGPDAPALSSTHLGLVSWVRTPPRLASGVSIVDVRDVALGVERALASSPARWMFGGTFVTFAQLHSEIARITGVARPAIPMPGPVLRLAGRAGDLAKRFVPFDYPLTYEAMVSATRACPYDSDATCRALDLRWRPVDETLADSIRWMASAGHLDRRLAGRLAS